VHVAEQQHETETEADSLVADVAELRVMDVEV